MYCFLFLFTPPTFTYELYQSEKCTSLGDFFFLEEFLPSLSSFNLNSEIRLTLEKRDMENC